MERESIEVLNNTDAFGMRFGSPISLEGFAESVVDHAAFEDIAVIVVYQIEQVVGIDGLFVIQPTLEFVMNLFQLDGVILPKKRIQQRPHLLDSFVFEIVAVGGRLNARIHRQQTEYNMPQIIRFFDVILFSDVGKEIIGQDFLYVGVVGVFGESFQILDGVFLGKNTPGIVDGGNKQVHHRFVFLYVEQARGYNV